MSSDSEIIERSRDTPGVFAGLYERHAGTIYRYAARRIGVAVADDVMSETFLVAFERRAAFDPTVGAALPWLYGIATTLMKKHARLEAASWRGMTAAGAAEVIVDDIEGLESRVDAEASVQRIGLALRRMAKRDRDALLLQAWADLSYEDIALALAVPVGTVRSRLNRARRVLREAISRGQAPTTEVEYERVDSAAQGA
ncbi:RNA polymerase sigma factor [Cryobacterium sp. M15]|jgi:RNA polymerase sigma-70 factor (ECF subfamily)|uniref:RNA polymerase sigma factor n=1 Tax=Cryobacterium sp. M15 TaxID=2048291 RepID=UPI000CE3E4F6|nr:sigma-70 family RNA polymerase sigma factor [Cryobacterium sp. M15]